jgi:hypothetical protein
VYYLVVGMLNAEESNWTREPMEQRDVASSKQPDTVHTSHPKATRRRNCKFDVLDSSYMCVLYGLFVRRPFDQSEAQTSLPALLGISLHALLIAPTAQYGEHVHAPTRTAAGFSNQLGISCNSMVRAWRLYPLRPILLPQSAPAD